jgi:toxin ParE1/3/4
MGAVTWSEPAVADLDAIRAYIARDSPRYADRMRERILRKVGLLTVVPTRGWIVPEFPRLGVREIVVKPYRILYELHGDDSLILAVVHGSRDLGKALDPDDWSTR